MYNVHTHTSPTRRNQLRRACTSLLAVFFSTFFHPLVKKSSVSEYITRALAHTHTRPRVLHTHTHTHNIIHNTSCADRERGTAAAEISSTPAAAPRRRDRKPQ
jgi:hypothetical protein